MIPLVQKKVKKGPRGDRSAELQHLTYLVDRIGSVYVALNSQNHLGSKRLIMVNFDAVVMNVLVMVLNAGGQMNMQLRTYIPLPADQHNDPHLIQPCFRAPDLFPVQHQLQIDDPSQRASRVASPVRLAHNARTQHRAAGPATGPGLDALLDRHATGLPRPGLPDRRGTVCCIPPGLLGDDAPALQARPDAALGAARRRPHDWRPVCQEGHDVVPEDVQAQDHSDGAAG